MKKTFFKTTQPMANENQTVKSLSAPEVSVSPKSIKEDMNGAKTEASGEKTSSIKHFSRKSMNAN